MFQYDLWAGEKTLKSLQKTLTLLETNLGLIEINECFPIDFIAARISALVPKDML